MLQDPRDEQGTGVGDVCLAAKGGGFAVIGEDKVGACVQKSGQGIPFTRVQSCRDSCGSPGQRGIIRRLDDFEFSFFLQLGECVGSGISGPCHFFKNTLDTQDFVMVEQVGEKAAFKKDDGR